MGYNDTGLNIPETYDTLMAQQAQLLAGKRHVQMFPVGSPELPLLEGFERHQNQRGVFHYRPGAMSLDDLDRLSAAGRENEVLNLGPFNKSDIAERMERGERILAIAEFDAAGLEIRAAAGVPSTAPEQVAYFEATKEEGNRIEVLDMIALLARRLS